MTQARTQTLGLWPIRHRPSRAELATSSPRRRQTYRAVLKPEAAKALADLRQRTGRPYSAIIEELLLAERARGLRSGTTVRS